MGDFILLAGAGLAGLLLGTFFFAGLWWTVRKGLASDRPALWFIGSTLLRTAVVLAGFYIVSRGSWSACGMCMLGFLIARVAVVMWLARRTTASTPKLEGEIELAAQSR